MAEEFEDDNGDDEPPDELDEFLDEIGELDEKKPQPVRDLRARVTLLEIRLGTAEATLSNIKLFLSIAVLFWIGTCFWRRM